MSVSVTGGATRSTAARVYDRLRKRSLRARTFNRANQYNDEVGLKVISDVVGKGTKFDHLLWNDYDHHAYVAGVRDALNAIEEECG